MTLDTHFYEADLCYAMDRLFADSARVKGAELSAEERLCYRAAVTGAAIQDVAEILEWQLSTARVFVSGTIKNYTKELVAQQQSPQQSTHCCNKMSWHQMPHILKKLGYERSLKLDEPDLLQAISSESCDFDVKRLIWEIKGAIYRAKFDGWQPMLPDFIGERADADIRAAIDRAQQSRTPAAERAAYIEAIKISRLLVVQDPLRYIQQVVKIAQNLSVIDRYEDSVPLALEFIDYLTTSEDRAKLFFVLARAYEAMALHTMQNNYRLQAIHYYRSVLLESQQRNYFALYNVFELNFKFAQKLKNCPEYLIEARMALRQFRQEFPQGGRDFHRHKSKVQEQVRGIRAQTKDPILLGDLDMILNW